MEEQSDRTNGQLTRPAPARNFAGYVLRKPSDIMQYKGACITLCGKGGVGKTTVAGGITKSDLTHKTLFVDLEGGAHVLNDDPNLDIIEVSSWSQLCAVMQKLIVNRGEYNSAVFDNMSEALELCKHHHNFYADPKQQLGLWNQITNDMVQLFRQGRDLARTNQFVMVYIMWDTTDAEDDMGNKFKHREVALNPKLAEKFMGIMDLVAWLETPPKPKKPYPPILHFDVDPLYPTKKRMNPKQQALMKLPDIIYNPDLGEIIDTIVGGKPWDVEAHTDKPAVRPTAEILAERRQVKTNG
jgi:phage nucleotide-binding protein